MNHNDLICRHHVLDNYNYNKLLRSVYTTNSFYFGFHNMFRSNMTIMKYYTNA
jgi:hypothetical protein